MLSIDVICEISRLLAAEELSQRAIARKLRVSRGIVQAIASGHRGIYGREHAVATARGGRDVRSPERCPGCGGLVFAPCRLCRARAYRRRLSIKQSRFETGPPRRVA
ncbi:MAG: hypothetical protein KF688_13940 [Pirellulales bacterium]|nr:hypothetical protein [Pirellulales bacterium]